tara:strand:+ start:94 stop:426 length:333 start_codon:yes stop_codon:yes gene_type:complete
MNWQLICNWDIKKENNKLFVTLTVNHVKGTRKFKEQAYGDDFVENYLKESNIKYEKLLAGNKVYNYNSEKHCTGTWVFSLPPTKKTKKTTQPIENKETVIKMNSKKTIKK